MNMQAPRGFVPVRYRNGACWNGAANMYHIPMADANEYSPGDAVKSAATGADVNGIADVTKALGTDTVRGVILGCFNANPRNPSLVGYSLDLTVQNIPAAKTRDYYVLVCDDKDVLYMIQDDGLNPGNLIAANVGMNASFTVTNPVAPQQNSASVLNSASFATTAALNLKVLGLEQLPNNAFGPYAWWLVSFNQHEFQGNTAGV